MKKIILLTSILSMVCCSLKDIYTEEPITGTWVSTKTYVIRGVREITTITFDLEKKYTRRQEVTCSENASDCEEERGNLETGSYSFSGDNQLTLSLSGSDNVSFSYTYKIRGTILTLLSSSGVSETYLKK